MTSPKLYLWSIVRGRFGNCVAKMDGSSIAVLAVLSPRLIARRRMVAGQAVCI